MPAPARDCFLDLLRSAVAGGTLTKLTLGKHRGRDPTLQNLLVRPVALKSGPHLAFVWRHATRDITKNHPPADALAQLEPLIGTDFLDAHLFTDTQIAQLECQPDGTARLHVKNTSSHAAAGADHDRAKAHPVSAAAPWLASLGVTNNRGQPREGMADKFRQIQKFTEIITHLITEAGLDASSNLRVVDMGSGKGYLTFAVAALLGERATVHGVEARPELVDLCNRAARESHLSNLSFAAGQIDSYPIETTPAKTGAAPDILIALHACDTATDDALAKGIAAGAKLVVVAPCCQKELRSQLSAPPVLADALRHGIFQERQAEFVTDALRAQLLEWAGYRTKVFEFISTEHTAKNLMIAAIKTRPAGDAATATHLREFAAFFGIRTQRLATHLGVALVA